MYNKVTHIMLQTTQGVHKTKITCTTLETHTMLEMHDFLQKTEKHNIHIPVPVPVLVWLYPCLRSLVWFVRIQRRRKFSEPD